MNKLIVVACCAMVLAPVGASAEVYKWKDSTGKMHYSDSPPLTNIPYTTLSGKKPANTLAPAASPNNTPNGGKPGDPAVGVPGKPGEAKPAADGKVDPAAQKKALEEKAAKEAEAKKQQEEKLAAEKRVKEQACRAARSKVAQFQQGGRIYRVNEKGEREYYGDQEIANELAQAQEDVAANCE